MRHTISIAKDFFCDGHCYLLTSSSLGGSGLTMQEIEDVLFRADPRETTERLLEKGVCLPFCFPGDCALDGATEFVLGDLTEREEQSWMARLAWKLNVPCGRLILGCGCLAEDLEPALRGEKPDPNYTIYQAIEIPPGEYAVEIYAFYASQTMRVALGAGGDHAGRDAREFDADEYGGRLLKVESEYKEYDGAEYIIRLAPLGENVPAMPEIEGGWFQKFEFRDAPKIREIE